MMSYGCLDSAEGPVSGISTSLIGLTYLQQPLSVLLPNFFLPQVICNLHIKAILKLSLKLSGLVSTNSVSERVFETGYVDFKLY